MHMVDEMTNVKKQHADWKMQLSGDFLGIDDIFIFWLGETDQVLLEKNNSKVKVHLIIKSYCNTWVLGKKWRQN